MATPAPAIGASPLATIPESSAPQATGSAAETPAVPATKTKPAEKKPAASAAPAATAASNEKKLTPKELKEKKKAEKAAKRVQNKDAGSSGGAGPGEKGAKEAAAVAAKGGKKQSEGPVSTIRIGGSAPKAKLAALAAKEAEAAAKDAEAVREHGLVGLLRDLEVEQNGKKKKLAFGIDNAHPDVHPAIITLGMQINKNVIVGSSARCLGFLLAIKRVIEDYETPPDSSLNRHLPGAYLSHQINYITSARPMATAMGNAVRWLKTEISNISPDITDELAKRTLADMIEGFIHERLTAADEMIINTACERYIEDGDVILTFGKSRVVEETLIEAHRRGLRFRVVSVDNRPMQEGQNLLVSMIKAGIAVNYIDLYAVEYIMQDVTKVFVGAHAVMANGALYSRSGTAVIAAAAKAQGIPLITLCQTIKFSEKINIDGIVNNELADPDLIVNTSRSHSFPIYGPLSSWREVANTTVVNFRYDVTAADNISMVVCEHGCVTPEGVSYVLRVSGMDR